MDSSLIDASKIFLLETRHIDTAAQKTDVPSNANITALNGYEWIMVSGRRNLNVGIRITPISINHKFQKQYIKP